MMTSWQIEAVALYLPLIAVAGLCWHLHPSRSEQVAMAHTAAWQAATLPWLNWQAQEREWWSFESEGALLFGMPVSFYLGWGVLWGPLATLMMAHLPSKRPVVWTMIGLIILDMVTMPMLEPVLRLEKNWWMGELIILALGLSPGLVLSHFTLLNRRADVRAFLISVAFVMMVLGVLPFALDELVEIPWGWELGFILLLGTPAIAAVREFVRAGGGTPIPYDPPQRFVTTGPYAYIRNPMQSCMAMSLLALGWYLEKPLPCLLAIVSVIYSVGIARWSEFRDLEKRFGVDWKQYRKQTRAWIPQLLPGDVEAKIYFDFKCETCRGIAKWFLKQAPKTLHVTPAGRHHRRATYLYPDGKTQVEGVAAIACGLQHIHLGWAYFGWLMQIPGVLTMAQVAMDLVFPPKKVRATCSGPEQELESVRE